MNPNSLKQREISTCAQLYRYSIGAKLMMIGVEKEAAKQQADAISTYKNVIASQEQEIKQLKAKVSAMEKQLATQQPSIVNGSPKSPIFSGAGPSVADTSKELIALRNDVDFYKQECEMMQRDLEDALVCIGEQGIEMKKMKQRLRELGEPIEDDDDEEEEDDEQ